MELRAILLCGGAAERWNNHLGVNKHLVPVQSEPLLKNTINKLIASGMSDIIVAGRGKDYELDETKFFFVDEENCNEPSQKFLSSRSIWPHERGVALLFGDVFFTTASIKEINQTPEDTINFIGRLTGSRVTGCKYKEIFAIVFSDKAYRVIDSALNEISLLSDSRPTGWQLYDILADKAAIGNLDDGLTVKFTHIDDFTEDFDYPEDYEKWLVGHNSMTVYRVEHERFDRKKWQRRMQLALGIGIAIGFLIGTLVWFSSTSV